MTQRAFPIVRAPAPGRALPVLVSIPHYGTEPIPGVAAGDYAQPSYATFAYGYADTFAADVYGGLDEAGATVIATPYSRLFVDLNRRRDDFRLCDGVVRSERGVVRTHTIYDTPIFSKNLTAEDLEARLVAFYDPYHRALDDWIARSVDAHGCALLIDAHTGSPNGMGEHEIVVGTRRGATAHPSLSAEVVSRFASHGFQPHQDTPGYAGGHIVRRLGEPAARNVHAVQLEVNASLLMATSRTEFMSQITRSERPARHEDNLSRVGQCMRELVPSLAACLRTGLCA